MLKYVLAVVLPVITLAIMGFIVYNLPKPEAQEQKEVPCEELVWMKDYPQARCVEYWNNVKETQ